MKFSFAYVKQNPVMFGAIFLVFGLGLYLLLNKGASASSGGGVVVNQAGVSDAQVAAATALQQTQIQAQTQINLAQLNLQGGAMQLDAQKDLAAMSLQYQMADLTASHDLGTKQIDASLEALTVQLNNTYQVQHDNNAFMLDYAKSAQDAANTSLMINATLQSHMADLQLEANNTNAVLSQIGTLKKKQRGQALAYLGGTVLGDPNAGSVSNNFKLKSGGGLLSGIVGGAVGLLT